MPLDVLIVSEGVCLIFHIRIGLRSVLMMP